MDELELEFNPDLNDAVIRLYELNKTAQNILDKEMVLRSLTNEQITTVLDNIEAESKQIIAGIKEFLEHEKEIHHENVLYENY